MIEERIGLTINEYLQWGNVELKQLWSCKEETKRFFYDYWDGDNKLRRLGVANNRMIEFS